MRLGQAVLLQSLVAVWHVEGRLFKYSLAFVADPEEICHHQLGCLRADKDGLGL